MNEENHGITAGNEEIKEQPTQGGRKKAASRQDLSSYFLQQSDLCAA